MHTRRSNEDVKHAENVPCYEILWNSNFSSPKLSDNYNDNYKDKDNDKDNCNLNRR